MKPAARRNARQFALQAIYSWQLNKENAAKIEEYFLTAGNYEEEEHQATEPKLQRPETDVDYFCELFSGVVEQHQTIDGKMRPYLSRPLQDLDQMELALLRMSIYEMMNRSDVPYKVVINEGIELYSELTVFLIGYQ